MTMDDGNRILAYETPRAEPARPTPVQFIIIASSSAWVITALACLWIASAYNYYLSHDPMGVWASPRRDTYEWWGFELPCLAALAAFAVLAISLLVFIFQRGWRQWPQLLFMLVSYIPAFGIFVCVADGYRLSFYP
jgi:hypothetical protein